MHTNRSKKVSDYNKPRTLGRLRWSRSKHKIEMFTVFFRHLSVCFAIQRDSRRSTPLTLIEQTHTHNTRMIQDWSLLDGLLDRQMNGKRRSRYNLESCVASWHLHGLCVCVVQRMSLFFIPGKAIGEKDTCKESEKIKNTTAKSRQHSKNQAKQ